MAPPRAGSRAVSRMIPETPSPSGLLGIVNLGELAGRMMKIPHFPRRSEGKLVVTQENKVGIDRTHAEERQVVTRRSPQDALDQAGKRPERGHRTDVKLDHGGVGGQKPGENDRSRAPAVAFLPEQEERA